MFDTLFGVGRSTYNESVVCDPDIEEINLDTVEECEGDPFEFAVSIMYENSLNMQNLENAVMCCEYAYLRDHGTEMVYESGVFKNFIEGAKNNIKKIWGKIVAFFKKIFSWIENTIRSDKKFVDKYSTKCKEAGTVTGLDLKGYKYNLTAAMDMLSKLDIVGVAITDEKDDVEDKLDTIRNNIVGTKNADDFKKEVEKKIKNGNTDKQTITTFDCSAAIEEVKTAKQTKRALNELYTSIKKKFDSMIKILKNVEKNSKAASKDGNLSSTEQEQAKKEAQLAHKNVKVLNSSCNMATLINNIGAKAITANNRQNKAFIVKALSKYEKDKDDKKDKSTNEGAYDSFFNFE